MKQWLFNHLKNISGWHTKRKLLVIAVDDYGNVRLDSKKARKRMDEAGLKVKNRFDAYDTLETHEDLEALFNVLFSVKDKNNNHAVLTPFALPCNIDFEAMKEESYQNYIYETLPVTFEKLGDNQPAAYQRTWNLWQEGIKNGFMAPQLHGREHFNLKVFLEKLKNRDKEIKIALQNRSYTSITSSDYSAHGYTAAFGFWNPEENESLIEIANDGFERFTEVFGYAPEHFMAPTSQVHSRVLKGLLQKGIKANDRAFIQRDHLGFGKYALRVNYTGKRTFGSLINIVRNVVFEPTDNDSIDSVDLAVSQIEAAFRLNKPAIISSHRVNFCGHIDTRNRKKGLGDLQKLLKKVVSKWPEVEFISSATLIEEMEKDYKNG